MRNEASLQELVHFEALEAAFDQVVATSGEFSKVCIALSLDPARDFRFSNLRDVDFSMADLRGFDFRGADLRGSYGSDVIFDSSTNLEEADLDGSCFALYYRESRLFRDNPLAERMYRVLLDGDPFEISSWLYDRFKRQRESHSILKNADQVTVAILCQKLLVDDIDLTKRTDLFHFLGRITKSRTELRELMLSIFARHSENTSLIEKFITVASSIHGGDLDIRHFIFRFCSAKSDRIRLSAFKATVNNGMFLENFEEMRAKFLGPDNAGLRKQLILEAAIALGRPYVAAVNQEAALEGITGADTLDLPELFDAETGMQIVSAIQRRAREINARVWARNRKNVSSDSPLVTKRIIFERQAEVLCSAPVLRTIFARDDPDRALAARRRISARRKRK